MIGLDPLVGLLAPNVCIGCGQEGSVLCKNCMKSAGDPIAPRCAGCKALNDSSRICAKCRIWLPLYSIQVASTYEGAYEQLLHLYKFDMKRQAAVSIVDIMLESTAKPSKDVIICPVPTAPSRIRQRGFDHALLLARKYQKGLRQNNKLSQVIGRRSNTRQLGSSRKQRIQQMEETFYIKNNAEVQGRTFLLIDDVITTGASLAAAARILKSAGAARVYAVVFAQKI